MRLGVRTCLPGTGSSSTHKDHRRSKTTRQKHIFVERVPGSWTSHKQLPCTWRLIWRDAGHNARSLLRVEKQLKNLLAMLLRVFKNRIANCLPDVTRGLQEELGIFWQVMRRCRRKVQYPLHLIANPDQRAC